MPAHYIYLFFAILAETVGTTALQASQQFTRFWPSVIVVGGYGLSFWSGYCVYRRDWVFRFWAKVRFTGHFGHGNDLGRDFGDSPVFQLGDALGRLWLAFSACARYGPANSEKGKRYGPSQYRDYRTR